MPRNCQTRFHQMTPTTSRLNQQQLEQELVRLDRIEIEINELLAKYQDSMQEDRQVRELISKQRL